VVSDILSSLIVPTLVLPSFLTSPEFSMSNMMNQPEEQMRHEELKHKARYAADTMIEAEKHKNDKELAPHLENEFKERAKHLKGAATKAAPKEAAKKPAPKAAPKKVEVKKPAAKKAK